MQVNDTEYIGLLRIKSLMEAAVKSYDDCTNVAGFRAMMDIMRRELSEFQTATEKNNDSSMG